MQEFVLFLKLDLAATMELKTTHPINCVTHAQAVAYTEWLDAQRDDIDIRLPTETEWEFAARSEGLDYRYAWGEQEADFCELGNIGVCALGSTTKVCNYSSTFGTDPDAPNGDTAEALCDMTGNISEWILGDATRNYIGFPADGSPYNDNFGFFKIHRGGSYVTAFNNLNNSHRSRRVFTIAAHHSWFPQ